MSPNKPSFCTTTKRRKNLKTNTSLTDQMSPNKDEKEREDEEQELDVQISFKDLEKSMNIFTGDDTYPIETFIDEFEDTANIMKWTKVEKLIYAKRLLDGTAKLFLRSLGRVKDYASLKKALKEEFGPKINSAIIHKKLASRKMKNDETYQQYFLSMKELALHGKVEDAALIEYVIDGIRDLETNKVILYGATDIKDFRKKLEIYSDFKKKLPNRSIQSGQTSGHHSTRKMTHVKRCYNCGDLDHQSPACPKGIKCFKCNEFGHKSTECTNKPKKTLNILNKNEEEKVPYKKIKINGKDFVTLIDTGSDINLITKSEFEKIKEGIADYKTGSTCITGIAEKEVYTEGMFTANVQIDNYYTDIKFHIVKDNEIPVTILIGNPILKEFEVSFTPEGIYLEKIMYLTLLMEEKDNEQDYDIEDSKYAGKIRKMCKEYKPDEKKKESNVELKIILTDEDPVFQNPRRLSPLEMNAVNTQVKEWLDKEIIKPSKSDFACPVVLANKKDGSRRMCIDYRRLNKKVIKERFPLPIIEDQIDKLKEAKMFTSLDLKNGFLHVKVHKDSQKYTSFVTPQGQYEFQRMPFGLCTAPSVFQRFINDIFSDLITDGTLLVYLDDLIIPSITEEEGISKLEKVLKRSEEFGLEFNWKKCHFLKKEIQYLGYIICDNEVRPSQEKIKAVANFKKPNNVKTVQSFLGLTGYFRKFIRNYSLIAKPMTDLLKKDAVFDFDDRCEKAFIELKQILCSSPVLRIFNPDLETELHTDASADGYGAVLLQRSPKDNQFHPVHYMSKKTTPAEKKYHSYYLEILAIVAAIKKFRVYLLGIHFKIITDCSALTMTLQKKDLPPRVARWALLLEEYDYKIEHRPGIRMRHADALSRHPICMMITEITARIKKAQNEDDYLRLIKKILETENYQDYIIQNEILYKKKDGSKLIVVPKNMQNEIIRKNHEKGHFGILKTEELINREYFIENLTEKIRKVINNCIECILISHKRGKKEGFLHPIDKGNVPLSTYHVDHLGPMTSTHKNYKYILTVVDAYTKFTWIYPVKTLTTEETLEKLRLQQQTFGAPERIITDRNAAFTANDFQEYCKTENITHYTITTGQPRGNGQVERIHQIIIAMLSKLSADDPTKWYRRVSKVQRCLNGTYQRSIKMTPFELLFGTKMREKDDEIQKLIEEENIQNFNEKREELRRKAKESIQKVQEENIRNYNKKRRVAITYNIGDLVAIRKTQFSQGSKLYPKYLGPYEVVKCNPNDRYAVKKIGNTEGPINTTTSADLMKPWISPEDDSSGADE